MNSLDLFRYDDAEVRVVVREGEPWFVAADVVTILGITRVHDAVRNLDEDERGTDTVRTLGGEQLVTLVNEAGLYSLILRSRKPEAKAFKRWITHDVLPAIRKTGSYGAPAGMTFEQMTAHVIGELNERIEAARQRVQELESPARAWNALSNASGDFTITDAAKVLGRDGQCPGPRQLHDWLQEKGWIFRRGGRWQVMQAAVNAGYMVERITSGYFDQETGERKQAKPQPRITPKGLERLRGLLAAERQLVLVDGDPA